MFPPIWIFSFGFLVSTSITASSGSIGGSGGIMLLAGEDRQSARGRHDKPDAPTPSLVTEKNDFLDVTVNGGCASVLIEDRMAHRQSGKELL
jgi:hypothetical protein